MKQPIGYIEGQPIELQATWKGGYPSVLGNITWFYTNDNTSEMTATRDVLYNYNYYVLTNKCIHLMCS
jgi:hypothetical protein